MRGPMHGCNQPPTFIETFSPLARLDRKTAFWIWHAAQFLCVIAAVLLLARGNDPPLGSVPTIIVLSLVLMSRPFAGALVWSQVAPMLLALLCAAWFCARRNRPAAAGMFVALAALLKLFPAGAAGYFLFGRRWRSLGWTIGFSVAGVLLTNPVHWIELVTHGLPISYRVVAARGTHRAVCRAKSRSALRRYHGPRSAGHRSLGIAALIDLALLAIAAAATITSRERADLDGLVFGMWVALALLMSPLAWIEETLLLLPLFLFGLIAAWQGYQSREPAEPRVDCRRRDACDLHRDRSDQGGAASRISDAVRSIPRCRADRACADAIGFGAYGSRLKACATEREILRSRASAHSRRESPRDRTRAESADCAGRTAWHSSRRRRRAAFPMRARRTPP